ncbi:MAG: fibronectin type III domain-containing protein [Acutalibacteraceae bacterium]
MKKILYLNLLALTIILFSSLLFVSANAEAVCPNPGGHSFTNYINNHDATCIDNETRTAKCDYCDETDTEEIEDSLAEHTYQITVRQGGFNTAGYKRKTCTLCGASETVEEYPAIKNVRVNHNYSSECEYDGKAKEPEIVLELDKNYKLTEGVDYTVRYKNNVNVGTAKAVITLQGNYKGEKEVDFLIIPGYVQNVNIRYDGVKSIITWDPIPGVSEYLVTLSNYSEDVPTVSKRVKTNSAEFDYLFPETLYELSIYPYAEDAEATELEFITPNLEYDKIEYTGQELKPAVDFGETAGYVENKDYTVTYQNNKSVGLAVAKVTLKKANTVSFDLVFRILPKKVTGLKLSSCTTDKLTLSWSKVTGAQSYMVYQSTDGKSWKKVSTVSTNSAKISSLKSGQNYQYKVRAYASSGYGAYSSVFKTQALTSAPKNLKVLAVSTTSIKLSWSTVFGALSYEVYQSTDGKKWSKVSTVKTNGATISKLSAGKKYQYKILSTCLTGKSAYSSVLKTQTLTSAPSIKLTSTKAKTATVSWSKVSGAAKYIVYKSKDGKKWEKYSTTTKTSVTISKLTSGKKLYVRVVAVNAYAKNSANSAVKSVTVK